MQREFKGFRDLIGKRYVWFAISLIIIAIGMGSMIPYKGMNLGVDFTGGVLLQYKTSRAVTTADVEKIVSTVDIKHNPVQVMGNGQEFLVRTVGCDEKADKNCNKFNAKLKDLKIKFRIAFTGLKAPVVELKYLDKPITKEDIAGFLGGEKDLAGVSTANIQVVTNPAVEKQAETYNVSVALNGAADQAAFEKASAALYDHYGGYELSTEKGETEVSPMFSQELFRRAALALVIATIGILIYVTIRFEFWFAIAAIIALLHDAAITTGLYALFRLEVNSSFVAVILTVFGYSINDTIVIFDRIRENLRKDKKMSWQELMNVSLWETMARSINTVLTVEITILAIIFFGGLSIRDFAIGMLFGITTGCYSSIFIAAPLAFMFKTFGGKNLRAEAAPAAAQAARKKQTPQQKAKAKAAAQAPATAKKAVKSERKAAEDKLAGESKKKEAATAAKTDGAAEDGAATAAKPAQKQVQGGGPKKDQKKGKQRRR